MNTNATARQRAAAASLVLAGCLSLIGLLLRGPNRPASVDASTFAEAAATAQHQLAWLVLLPGPLLLMFGFFAIWAAVRHTPQERLAFRGAILSVIGNGLYMPALGISTFVDRPAAELYLDGHEVAVEVVVRSMFEGPGLSVLLISVIFLLIGSAMQAIAIWRSEVLPRFAALPWMGQAIGLTIAAQFAYSIELTGGVLLFVASWWLGLAIWRDTTTASSPGPAALPR